MYFGSVRFFKHMILAVLVFLLAGMIVLCVLLGIQNHSYKVRLGEARQPAASGSGWTAMAAELQPPEPVRPLEGPDYQALYPDLYTDGEGRSTLNEDKVVYLTFDDGPSERTPEVLDILARYGVKATFFVSGRGDEQSRRWLRDIADGGHTLGLHSYSHDYPAVYASVEAFLADCDKLRSLIYDATGAQPQLLRFPGGSVNTYNAGVYQELIAEMTRRGYAYFDWNCTAADAAAADAAAVTESALGGAGLNRAVLLLHDSAGRSATVEALPAIIEGYRDLGYTFEALTPEVVPVVFGYPE